MTDLRVVLLSMAAMIFLLAGCWFIDLTLSSRNVRKGAGYAACVFLCMIMCAIIGMKAINHYKCNAGNCIEVNIIGAFYGR